MKYIKTNWDEPYYNFALEEYLLTKAPLDNYVFFYIHKPAIIIGKHQNTIEEINKAYVEDKNIIVARRLSGGGAVYHDHGNLNFSFVMPAVRKDVNNFEKFVGPVITALKDLGLPAQMSGRNDILLDGKKISGNAQYFTNNRILSHGTLLFDADMSELGKALQVNELKIQSKGIKSVRSRVANITDYLADSMTIYELKDHILTHLAHQGDVEEYVLSAEEKAYIDQKAKEKYATWDWIWGKSPTFALRKADKFPFGILDVRLDVHKGTIKDIKIFGDFISRNDITELEEALRGAPYHYEGVLSALSSLTIEDYFHEASPEEIARFITK